MTLLRKQSERVYHLVSAPLVDKKAFEHKRDWVQAWQQALQRVQDDLRKTDELLSRKAAALQSRERDLQHKQGIVLDAGSRLHTLLSRMREDCDAIASVKAMQEDHEEELLKRLEQVQEQEYIIRQDSYIISNKGKRPYEKEAADFRRVEELRGLKRELETRIKEVTDYEQELLHSSTKGGAPSAGRLPRTDDLPDI